MQSITPIHSSSALRSLKARARQLRNNPTPSEETLWHYLRQQRLGVHFRHQQIVGQLIVDFLAPRIKLVVEISDGYQAVPTVADAHHDRNLRLAGYTVLRLSNRLVLEQTAVAVAHVLSAVRGLSAGATVFAA